MTDNSELIRKVIEFTPGWGFADAGFDEDIVESPSGYRGALPATPELLDALAAAAWRELDRIGEYGIFNCNVHTGRYELWRLSLARKIAETPNGTDRSEAMIELIGGILE